MGSRGRFVRFVCLMVLTVALFGCDHATKIAAKASLEGAAAVPIAPEVLRGAVELRYVENDDVAFSVLHMLGVPRSPGMLVAIALCALAALVVTVIAGRGSYGEKGRGSFLSADRATLVGFALTVGGALGNLVDRMARGYVVDFIHVKGWPVFNVADIAVVAGVALIALARLRRPGVTAGP